MLSSASLNLVGTLIFFIMVKIHVKITQILRHQLRHVKLVTALISYIEKVQTYLHYLPCLKCVELCHELNNEELKEIALNRLGN